MFSQHTIKTNWPIDESVLIFCARCGPLFFLLYFAGQMIAGLVPVLPADLSAEQLANFYRSNTNMIRVGLCIAFVSAAFYLPFTAVIAAQIRRTEGSTPILTYIQLAGGLGTGFLNFLIPMLCLLTASFRPERSPEITQAFHDFAWLTMVIILNTNCVQYFAIGRAISRNHQLSDDPIFPRWIIYVNYVTGFSYFIDILIVFYKTGPFSWDGVVALYVTSVLWIIWIFSMAHVLVKAIRREAELE